MSEGFRALRAAVIGVGAMGQHHARTDGVAPATAGLSHRRAAGVRRGSAEESGQERDGGVSLRCGVFNHFVGWKRKEVRLGP